MTEQLPVWADPGVPDGDLDRQGLSRRTMLRSAGLFGSGFAAASVGLPQAASAAPATASGEYVYLVGDHHVHTQYSHDAKYTLAQAAQRTAQFGLDWMVCTEHSNFGHEDPVTSASRPNFHGVLPRPAYLDVIRGAVRGPAADRDGWTAPDTRVVETADVSGRSGTYTLRFSLGAGATSGYLRLRGADGRRHGPGLLGSRIDPHGPIPHPPGDGDPWLDTWLYTNPIFIDVA